MATPLINGAATTTSLGSMKTTNLFDSPHKACSLALAIAGLQSDGDDVPQQTATSTLVAQPVPNPDIAGVGNAVDQAILTYADLQIATGVGILVAACSTIRSLSLYHLQVAIYLAWMSSNTHLTAVSLLQVDFRENSNKSIVRRLRLGGMVFLGVFLLVALVPTTSYNWLSIITESKGRGYVIGQSHSTTLSPAGIPARCFWDPRYSGKRTADAAWSFIILVLSYVWKGLLLFQRSQEVAKVLCRQRVLRPLQRSLDRYAALARHDRRTRRSRWFTLRYKGTFCLYLAAWAVFELAQSFVMSLWICGGGLIWGSFQILVPRQRLSAQILEAENSWTFGQILPVMLLAVPVLSFAQGYATQKAEKDHQDDGERDQTSSIASLDRASSQNPDRISSAIQMATEDNSKPAEDGPSTAAESPQTTPDLSGAVAEVNNENQGTPHLPPWHDEPRIYASRFIIAAFWGSQVGILALGTFIVLYLGLFFPLGIAGKNETEAKLRSNSWIWIIVGCAVVCWVAVAAGLLVCGAFFSTLFDFENVEGGEEGLEESVQGELRGEFA
ncbi:MAG: hypothetical protein Q9194_003437 [Teloschistes cf. exilis]